jgi:hypothetical protein
MKTLVVLLISIAVGCWGRDVLAQAPSDTGPAESSKPSVPEAQSSKPSVPEAETEPAATSRSGRTRPVREVRQEHGRFGVRTSVVFASEERDTLKPHNALVCMLNGALPEEIKYVEIGRITATKGTYGGVDEVLQAMADEGRRIGVNAIVELRSRQRGSVLPWRHASPIGNGRLVKLDADSPALDCEKIGGKPN